MRRIYETVEALAAGWETAVVRNKKVVEVRKEPRVPKKTPDYDNSVFEKAAEKLPKVINKKTGEQKHMASETVKRYFYEFKKNLEK
jgi:hypothetical protein